MKLYLTTRRVFFKTAAFGMIALVSGCAQAQITPSPPLGGQAALSEGASKKANIGVGLEGLADYSRAQMFADLMKTSRRQGRSDQLWVHKVKTDALGQPAKDAGVIAIADTPGIEGTYALSFDGKANVRGHSKVKVENLKFDGQTDFEEVLTESLDGAECHEVLIEQNKAKFAVPKR